MEELLRQVAGYRANGLNIACDCYPYFAFSTRIGATTYDDGWLERYHCDYSACQLMEGKYKGQRCTPETFAEMRRDFPECLTVCYVMMESDIRKAFSDPGRDGGATASSITDRDIQGLREPSPGFWPSL